jgi:hypothetical protein
MLLFSCLESALLSPTSPDIQMMAPIKKEENRGIPPESARLSEEAKEGVCTNWQTKRKSKGTKQQESQYINQFTQERILCRKDQEKRVHGIGNRMQYQTIFIDRISDETINIM